MKIVKCWKCHQDIWHAETEMGKTMPVNAWTSPKGKIIPVDPESDKPVIQFLKKGDPEPGPEVRRYVSHMATCKRRK